MPELRAKIRGMSCASCAQSIEKNVRKISGVGSCSVNFATETGRFRFEDESVKEQIKEEIKDLGFSLLSGDSLDESVEEKERGDLYKAIFSFILSLMIFTLAMGPLKQWPSTRINHLLQLFLASFIWIWIGLPFIKAVFLFIRKLHSNMNTLIGLGTSSAFIYSLIITLFPNQFGLKQQVYFEAVGFITSFVYFGQYLEGLAKKKTKMALQSLLKLGAKKASVLVNGKFLDVDIEEVKRGDVLRVLPGEKVPVDGLITKGESYIDEAMISGEPLPVNKKKGDQVFSATINGQSVIELKAEKIGSETLLSQIISFVENAQESKAPIQRYADRVSQFFVPAVMAIAILTFLLWFFLSKNTGAAISNMISVLVIACPCALGLATPTAIVVATGRASQNGILIAGGEVIEKTQNLDTIIFDKTGTLTEGRPEVVSFTVVKGENEEEILRDVASIETYSEHPLSRAIIDFSKTRKINLTDPDSFEVIKGKGVIASFDNGDNNDEYFIGNARFLREQDIKVSESTSLGSSVYVSKNKKHIATFLIADKLRPSSSKIIQSLKELGMDIWLITGDNRLTGTKLAEDLKIKNIICEALPEDKIKKVKELQGLGRKVGMIGDGINDAPALAQADLSFAMGSGSDVAINTSDVTLVRPDLEKVLQFLILRKGSMRIIKENLFLSLMYNSLLIPIAAGVLYPFGGPLLPPILASIAMGLSSLSVVSNSLRIKNII